MDLLTVLKFVAALGLVLSMIGGCAFLASKLNLISNLTQKGDTRRMRVVESLVLDAKHRMMIVESGLREHVLLFGPNGDVVIESRLAGEGVLSSDTDGTGDEQDPNIVKLLQEAKA